VKAALYATHDRGPALMGSPAKCREVAESAHPDREGACHQRRYARFRHADRRVAGSEPRCGTSSSSRLRSDPTARQLRRPAPAGSPLWRGGHVALVRRARRQGSPDRGSASKPCWAGSGASRRAPLNTPSWRRTYRPTLASCFRQLSASLPRTWPCTALSATQRSSFVVGGWALLPECLPRCRQEPELSEDRCRVPVVVDLCKPVAGNPEERRAAYRERLPACGHLGPVALLRARHRPRRRRILPFGLRQS